MSVATYLMSEKAGKDKILDRAIEENIFRVFHQSIF